MATSKLFAADDTVIFNHYDRFSQVRIGEAGAADFGGGELRFKVTNFSGNVHTFRTITAADFAALQDKTVQFELPADTDFTVELSGSTAPDLYIEHREQRSR